jgi:Tol biopolymer transport system component
LKIQFRIPWSLIFVIALSACSIDLSQSALNTPTPPAVTIPSVLPAGDTTDQAPGTLPSTTLPVTWEHLGLSGKLVYNSAVFQDQFVLINVQTLDLTTGAVRTIYQAPAGGWVDAVAVSPDGKELVLSYIAPLDAPDGGTKALYHMPLDGSEPPQLLFPRPSSHDQYSQPVWSPDGSYVYFTHIDDQIINLEVWRMAYPDGELEKLADNGSWPRLSPDGARLVYVWIDPETRRNQLFLANADGSEAHQIPLTGLSAPTIIDAPMLSADNQSIVFSAPTPGQSSAPGPIRVRLEHSRPLTNGSVPSDWWSVPVAGGEPDQLTNTHSLSLFGNYSPDKKHIVVYSTDGIYVMNPDGSELTVLVDDIGQIAGTVNWIP